MKIIIKKLFILSCCAAVCVVFSCGWGKKLTLVDDGYSLYAIIISKNASPSERHAAEELQYFIEAISGVTIPLRIDEIPASDRMILIGQSSKLREMGININEADLSDEGFIIRTENSHLILAGGRLRGTMYAVYTFLEDILGCRWYTSKVSHIPQTKTISIPALNITQKPAFEYREPFWTEAFDRNWAARNKCNGPSARLDSTKGGAVAYRGVHTFYQDHMLPPSRYFKDHPEYFSLLGGQRTSERAQLCLTNPELVKLAAYKMKEWIKSDPDGKIFSLSQNDWYGACTCPHCAAVDSAEKSHSGSLLYFVNAVAVRIDEKYPDKYIGTLAYQYTEKPPEHIRPRENVIIRLCHMKPSCETHPVETCPLNARFKENLERWRLIAKKLYIWDYYVNFAHYLLPFPNFNALRKDISFFKKMNVDGVFCQGDYAPGGGGEMAELRAYVLAKLLWNPSADVDEIIDDFLRGYFGKAAGSIRNYFDFLHEKVKEENICANLYSPPQAGYLTEDVIRKSERFFDEAEAQCENEEQLQRIRRYRLPIQYAKLVTPVSYVFGEDIYQPDPSSVNYFIPGELDNFFNTLRSFGITQLREGTPLEMSQKWCSLRNTSYEVIHLENPWLRLDIIPGLGGRIVRLIHKKSGMNLLKNGNINDYTYPASGGYTEESLKTSPYLPFNYKHIPAAAVEGEKVVMTAALDDLRRKGIAQMTRMITLLINQPVIEIYSTIKCLQPYDHNISITAIGEFSLGNPDSLIIGFAGRDNTIHPLTLSHASEGWVHKTYQEEYFAHGSWGIANLSTGVGIIDHFNPESIEESIIGINYEEKGVAFSLKCKSAHLDPGERTSFRHIIEVTETPHRTFVKK